MKTKTTDASKQLANGKPRRSLLWLAGPTMLVLLSLGVWSLVREPPPILLGVSISLSGPEASVGHSVLNGVRMAVEEQNAAGGVRGREVELLVKDDKGYPQVGIRNDRELLEAGVVAIWGHMPSRVAEPAVDAMAQLDPHMLYINSISTARSLTGRDDNLIRVTPDGAVMGEAYAEAFLPRSKDKRVALIYEATFPALSDTLRPVFVHKWQKLGGVVTAEVGMDSESYDARQVARQALRDRPSSVFLGLPPLPAAVVSQHLRAQMPEVELLVYPWALSQPDFRSSGGKAVEGALGLSRIPPIPETPRHIRYAQSYEARYNLRSTRADAMAYEAMQVLLWALQQTDDRRRYKSLILQKGTFDGLADSLVLDAYGDARRPFYVVRLRDGRLVNEGKLQSPSAVDSAREIE